jgi:hypothetical protein
MKLPPIEYTGGDEARVKSDDVVSLKVESMYHYISYKRFHLTSKCCFCPPRCAMCSLRCSIRA